MDKSYRIHTNIAEDTLLQVDMRQDFDFLEVLSLQLRQKDAYRLHSSNYGVIIGRVLANDAFGIPNAKLSIFIERDGNDTSDMEYIYPYSEVTSKDKEGRRYNLLPDYSDDDCYRVVGTFPNKRLMLDDDIQLEIYDKYYKYTTVTNNAGDYMIFGVPTGSVTVHVDIDLSDIGVLSQKPRDFEYKGYNLSMFDSPVQFKESTNLDNLAQLFSQNKSVFVYPFWGDTDNGVASITRSDIQIQYKFEPTCVFMGSIVSDNEGHAIGHKCAPDVENGMNDQLVGGNGTIEMIRKTTDGLVEEYQIQGNQLIDENGVWCYQIPMNLDFIGTDEYGNIVPTDNPNKGIPTRAQVRFRISKNETSDEGFSRHTAKYLVPMNPIFSEEAVIPTIKDKGLEIEKMYRFGSSTPISCFRDLYWNNVYSVKNYIPKTQVAHRAYSKNYSALKGSNLAEDQNPIPFNKLRIDMPFLYMIVCLIFTMIVYIVSVINFVIICTIDDVLGLLWAIKTTKIPIINIRPFSWLPVPGYLGCISLSAGISEGNIAYYPGCRCNSGMRAASCPEDMDNCEKSDKTKDLLDKIQRNLAQEFKIVKLDLYQDWVNGCLYMPLWYWRKRKKKSFLFGLFTSRAKNEYCSDSRIYSRLKTYVTCNIGYISRSLEVSNNGQSMPDSEDRWHKNRTGQVRYTRGLIKQIENNDGLNVYYYSALQATTDNANDEMLMEKRSGDFYAVRLFATDIILLGNLDPDNIYGIPQFFTCLPSTTANVPPIATIEETINPNEQVQTSDNDATNGGTEDSGTTVTTGMDWNHNGDSQTPKYGTGLFMDLECTYAATRPKSCINVERLSELGVSTDMTHNMAYHTDGNDVQYGQIDSDGFITKYELDDMENRAMFATLNHIGFIPQEYQDEHKYYNTQVQDKNTNYLIPKFKYIYPVDFDGRMQLPMNLYKNGFEQATFDERDESYITFRLGAEKGEEAKNNSEGRIRHFYHANGSWFDMPLYNNSYYFYFGIKKGSTAIDKFNEMFYASCFQNSKKPFTLDIETQGRSYCPSAYSDDNKKKNAYGYIRLNLDDIRTPYSYALYDSFGMLIISEDDMNESSFVIGGTVDENGETISNEEGKIVYQKTGGGLNIEEPWIKNQEYVIEVIDSDGKKISEKVKVEVPKIKGEYKATGLGTKFYNSATTRMDYICNDNNAFYGKIEMLGFTVDGYSCEITGVEFIGYSAPDNDDTKGKYIFCISGKSNDISSVVVAYLEIMALKTTSENVLRNCFCDDNDNNSQGNIRNLIRDGQSDVRMQINVGNDGVKYFLSFGEGKITWNMYQPNSYVMTISQGCDTCENENPNRNPSECLKGCPSCGKIIEENSTSEIVTVTNGEAFMTKLNTMPTRFMLGTNGDSSSASIANTSHFYNSTCVTGVTLTPPGDITIASESSITGWYGVHEEDSYMFSNREENKTYNANQYTWDDVVDDLNDSVASPEMKRKILKMKFNAMFALSEATYVTTESSRKFEFSARGGISPILYRSVAPMYEDSTKMLTTHVLTDFFSTECAVSFPNIVADNYSKALDIYHNPITQIKPYGATFNYLYNYRNYCGNYFAAFTRDGSYITKKKIDGNLSIERSPSFASISPVASGLKKKGQDEAGDIIYHFQLAHTLGNQQLPDDINRNTLPYLRAMYVDRRFDFDFTILAPVLNNGINLYSGSTDDISIDRERPWRSGRISGFTYNGIEMAYDEDYNVISANNISVVTNTNMVSHLTAVTNPNITNETVEWGSNSNLEEDSNNGTNESIAQELGFDDVIYSAATFNKRLEYTYKYDSAHICLDCGWQGKEMSTTCPNCHGTNINYFHGENVDIYNNHSADTVNFSEGSIYTLDDAITYYHKWHGSDNKCDVSNSNEYRWGNWNVNEDSYHSFGFNGVESKYGISDNEIDFQFMRTSAPINMTNELAGENNNSQEWHNEALGVTSVESYEYVRVRIKENGNWSNYSAPMIWSKFGEKAMNGGGIEYIFNSSIESSILDEQNLDESSVAPIGQQFDGYVPLGWSNQPLATPSQVYCIRKKNGNGDWSVFSKPKYWSADTSNDSHYDFRYKSSDDNNIVVPTGNALTDGWRKTLTNSDKKSGNHIWMTQRIGNGEWDKPIRINSVVKGYDKEDQDTPLIKQFYESEIANLDIKHLYWSLFNYDRINYYTSRYGDGKNKPNQQIGGYGIDALNNNINPCYVYHYPCEYWSGNTYNGDFNREDVANEYSVKISDTESVEYGKSYPTKRFIDIGNLPIHSRYTYENQCCSYSMEAIVDEDGTIRAETNGGETFEIDLDWASPITWVTPDDADDDYANITFSSSTNTTDNDYVYFNIVSSAISLSFRYNQFSCDDFEVYTRTPKIIQVLPYIQKKDIDGTMQQTDIDGIGFYKTCNEGSEFSNGKYGDGFNLTSSIHHITLAKGRFETAFSTRPEEVDIFMPINVRKQGPEAYETKYGLKVHLDTSFFTKDGLFLESNDEAFSNILFKKTLDNSSNGLYNDNTKQQAFVFAILVEREYRYMEDDNLIRHLRTVETSDLYDIRKLKIKKEVSVVTKPNIQNPTSQTLTYDLYFVNDKKNHSEEHFNEAFKDVDNMTYTFRYYFQNDNIQDIEVEVDNVKIEKDASGETLHLTVNWKKSDDLPDVPTDNIKTELYGRTSSNFTYKLTGFKTEESGGAYNITIISPQTNSTN